MKKIITLIPVIIILFITMSIAVSADSTSAALSSAQVIESIQITDPVGYNPPYSKDDFPAEYIEPLGGSLTLTEDILYLPGKNGFDINLSATYNSNEIGVSIYTESSAYEQDFTKRAYYYSYDNNGTKEYILVLPDYEEQLASVDYNSFYVKSISEYPSTDDFDTEFYWFDTLNTSEQNILLTREVDMAPVTICWVENSTLSKAEPNTERLNFSDIWKWNIPYITEEIHPLVNYSSDTYQDFMQISAFTDFDGEYCKIKLMHSKKKSNGVISNATITITDGTGDYAGYYTGEDIVDTERNITYRCSITDSLGRTMFFTQSGFLCAAEDRFGNIIRYHIEEANINYGRINQIVDTLGRTITFAYNNDDVSIFVAPNATEPTVLYAEIKNSRTNSVKDSTDVFDFDDECISTIIRYEDSETEYVKSFKYSKYHQALYTSIFNYAHHMPIECEVVKEINHPNGAETVFDYTRTNNTTESVKKERYSVSERYDKDGTNKFNQFTYTYTPGSSSVETRDLDGQIITNEGETRVSTKTTEIGEDYYEENYLYVNRKLSTTKQRYYINGNLGVERKVSTNNSLRRPSKIAYDDYTKTITYFDNSSFVETEIHNQSEDVFIKTTYTLSEEGNDFYQGRTIDSMTVSESTDGGDTYTDKYTVQYTYNTDGTLASEVADPDGINKVTSYAYTYNADGSITTTATVSNLNDADGNAIDDITTSTTVDYLGNLVSSTDGNGNVTTYEYDRLGRLIKVTNPDDTTVTYEYDTQNRTTVMTDENGIMQKSLYDAFGNVLAVYKNAGTNASPVWVAVAEYEYDALCRPVCTTEYTSFNGTTPEKWIETHYSYGAFDNVSEFAVYDEAGEELSKQTYTYDFSDRIGASSALEEHDTINGGTAYKFTSVTIETAPKDGITPPTVTQYLDRQGRLCKQIRTDGDNKYISTYIYDAVSNVLEYKDESAYTDYDVDYSQKYEYNYLNKPVKVYNAEGNFTESTYDTLGNLISQTDYMGNSTTYTYDSMGRQLTESAPVDTNRTSLVKTYYDANSNVIRMTKAIGVTNTTVSYTYTYDNRNRLVSSFDGATYSVNEYDGSFIVKTASGLPSVMDISDLDYTDTTYNVSEFVYDNLGNITSETTFNGTTSYTYDLAGNTLTTTDPKGNTTTNIYDSRKNLLSSSVQGDVITYSYNALGLITEADRNGTATVYTYDNLGRNISEATGSNTITRTYNTAGQVATMSLKEGDTVLQSAEYEYNVLGNMTSAFDGTDNVVYTYNENGLPITEEKNALITNYTYTPGNLMKSVTHTRRRINDPANEEGYNDIRDISQFSYNYTNDGNVCNSYEVRNGKAKYTYYTYDSANRLLHMGITDNADNLLRMWKYTYNNRGDRISQSVTDENGVVTTTTYTYTNHRLTSESTNGNVTIYTYDANGNTLTKASDDATYQYTYTPRNEVATVTIGNIIYSYAYNASSLRTSKTSNGVTTNFIWAGDNIIREQTPDKATDYFYGVNRVSRKVTGDAYTYNVTESTYDETLEDYVETVTPVDCYREYYAYDGRGNVVHTMAIDSIDLYISPFYGCAAPFPEADFNGDGEFDFTDLNSASTYYPIVRDYFYSPFGEIWQGEIECDTNPFRFAGEYLDKETGDIYLRARYYDPSIGRFISVDPIKDGTNWYVYCSNNPIAFVDPSGLRDESLEVLVEACGGTITYNENNTYIKIVVGDKTITYESLLDDFYLQDGEIYVDGDGFASKLGATYTELETDSYTGFTLSYDNGNYYSDSISLSVSKSIEGESFSNELNNQQNANAAISITITGGAVSLYAGVISGGVGFVAGIVTTIVGAASSTIDFSYNLQINERITTTYSVNCSSENAQAYGLEQVTVRNADNQVRVNEKILHQ